MKKTLLSGLPDGISCGLDKIVKGARVFDSSSSPEARVYYIEKDDGYFLKTAARGALRREWEMSSYFHRLGLGAEPILYDEGECDRLLTRRLVGEDCIHERYIADPKRLCDLLAEGLRRLHELDASSCPAKDRVSEYIALAEENYRADNYDKSHFPDSFGYSSPEEAYHVMCEGRSLLKNEVLLHGDYCMPNIILNDWRLSGYIDLGCAGVGDRHIDLFWGRWSLAFNLKTDEYCERFLDAYGRDKVSDDLLRVVAAIEVFG